MKEEKGHTNCCVQGNRKKRIAVRKQKRDVLKKVFLKRKSNMSSGIILNKVVPLFFATKFDWKPRSPPYFDLISKIQIGGKGNGL